MIAGLAKQFGREEFCQRVGRVVTGGNVRQMKVIAVDVLLQKMKPDVDLSSPMLVERV